MPVKEITDRLGLNQIHDRPWNVQAACALSGDGLVEGFDWLTKTLIEKTRESKASAAAQKK